ncbi:ABC-type amino acid transport substrate-binding protein [Aquamicrobium terrae]|uniref:ABC-type amino acid transport substrate-binding protein n=1 Tax=Aquamicrobium terrae TaxID=1324945 RepID=A0ABV2N2F5_9HYPH
MIFERMLHPAKLLCSAGLLLSLTVAGQTATLDQIKSQGYIRAATANEVPYGYMDTDGTAKGIAPEVAEAVLKKMGINEVQWVVTPFGSLIPGLKANRFDLVAAEQDSASARTTGQADRKIRTCGQYLCRRRELFDPMAHTVPHVP